MAVPGEAVRHVLATSAPGLRVDRIGRLDDAFLAALGLPAFGAARIDPNQVLRSE